MSTPRESFVLVLLANAVVTVIVVAAGIMLFAPRVGAPAPGSTKAVESRVAEIERDNDALRARLDDFDLKHAGQAIRIAKLEAAAVALAPTADAAAVGPGTSPDAGAPKPPTPEEAFAKSIQAMMKGQIARQRDRFVSDIMNPDADSIARQDRQAARMAEQVTRGLNLDPRDAAEVERILLEVDKNRREKLRQLFTSKPKPEDITYPELKEVLDESFAEEDSKIKQSLPPQKAEEYQEAAAPFRSFVLVAAQTAFPGQPEPK